MPVHLIALALLGLPLPNLSVPWGHHSPNPLAGWALHVQTDHFSGAAICSLTKGRMSYERQAITFHLPYRINTFTAVYRIDGGPPRAVQDDQMDLARLGFALHRDDLANPSGGLVRIPADRLLHAGAISIETSTKYRPFRFTLNGLPAALDAAARAGCIADSFR